MSGPRPAGWSVTESLGEAEDAVIYRIELKPHWVNGWFLRLFAKPALVVGSREYPLSWTASTEVEVDDASRIMIGVGIRYFRGGRLLGVHGTELPREPAPQNGPVDLTFRNGLWNHGPFVLVD